MDTACDCNSRGVIAKASRFGLALILTSAMFPAISIASDQGTGASTEASEVLQEITVISTKTNEVLERAPAAITLMTGDELTDMGITNIGGMSDLIPSTRIEPFESATHLYVRGIGSEQDRNFVNQLVATEIDGVYMPRNTTNIPQFDVGQVEMLPGPQGTLYGASASGGVLEIANNRPTQNSEINLLSEVGNYGAVHGTLVDNVPISSTVAVRAALDYDEHNNYEVGGGDSENYAAGRISLLAKPTDDFTAYVWATYNRNTGNPANLVVTTGNGPSFATSNPWNGTYCITSPCSFVPFQNVGKNWGDVSVTVVAGQFDWKVGNGTLTFIPTYVNSSSAETDYVGPLSDIISTTNTQYTGELRLTQDLTPQLKLIAGLYWLKINAFLNYAVGAPPDPVVWNYENDYAGYAQLTYSLADNLRVIGGARYGSQQKKDDYLIPALAPAEHTWDPVDWKAGIEYDLTQTSMLYAAAQTGFTNGTYDYRVTTTDNQPTLVAPTKLYSYTAGIKNRLLDGRLEVNDEIFYYDYKNYLIQTVEILADGENVNVFFTAPKAVSFGDQLDLRALITENLQLRATFAYDHARASTFTTPPGSGQATYYNQKLFEAPEVTTSLGAQYRFRLPNGGNVMGLVDTYISDGYLDDDFPADYGSQQYGYTRTNASLTYNAPSDRWSLGVYCNNLENGAQAMPGATIDSGKTIGVFALAPPRTYGIRFSAHLLNTPSQ
jgi:iron complex outermembrane recepter protein